MLAPLVASRIEIVSFVALATYTRARPATTARGSFVGRQRDGERIASDADRLRDRTRGDVDRHEPIVELIDDEQPAAVAAHGEVASEAVLEPAGIQIDRRHDRC